MKGCIQSKKRFKTPDLSVGFELPLLWSLHAHCTLNKLYFVLLIGKFFRIFFILRFWLLRPQLTLVKKLLRTALNFSGGFRFRVFKSPIWKLSEIFGCGQEFWVVSDKNPSLEALIVTDCQLLKSNC